MARAHCLRHQRSNAACGYRRKLRARQPGATDGRRHSGSRARSAGSVADIRRRPDNGREPEEAGSEGAASTKNHQTTGCAARAPGRAAAAICLVWRPHVVVSTPKRSVVGKQSVQDGKESRKARCDGCPCVSGAIERSSGFESLGLPRPLFTMIRSFNLIRAEMKPQCGSGAKLHKSFECLLHGRCPSTTREVPLARDAPNGASSEDS